MEQAKDAQIPRHYAFPDEEGNAELVDLVLKLLAELDPQEEAGGSGAGDDAMIMPVDVARRFLGRKGKNMSDDVSYIEGSMALCWCLPAYVRPALDLTDLLFFPSKKKDAFQKEKAETLR